MTELVPFTPDQTEQVVALWRSLHADWTWLDEPEARKRAFEEIPDFHRTLLVLRRGGRIAATFTSGYAKNGRGPRNRHIGIEVMPEDVGDWIMPVLAELAEADRAHPGTWHIARMDDRAIAALAPRLAVAGFAFHSTNVRMRWEGESVSLVDPGPIRIETYTGGDAAVDQAIAALHDQGYRTSRVVPQANVPDMWRAIPGATCHEMLLAWDGDRLVGFIEYLAVKGEAWVNSLVVARSHWGTPAAAAIGTRAMQRLFEAGHRTIESYVRSNNAASIKLQIKLGWRKHSETSGVYVREL